MKRTLTTLMVLAAFAGFASAANAASVVMSSLGGNTASPGDVITIQTHVSVTSAETAVAIFGAITYTGAHVAAAAVPSTTNSQTALPGWATSLSPLSCTSARCLAFSQIDGSPPNNPLTQVSFLISETKFTVHLTTPLGTITNFNWQTTPSTQRLLFFGVPFAQPGVSVTIVAIPEPTTAAMLGLGLLGLALAGRRRA